MHSRGQRETEARLYRRSAALLAGAASLALAAIPAKAQDRQHPARNLFGSVGLIDLPTARMAPDGELWAGASFFERNERFNLGFQVLPWLETSFRYSGLSHFNPEYPVYWDRSFAVKARLVEESGLLPALAVGVNDVVGTGIYGGEYVVTSKRFGNVDATIGLGWGRLGTNGAFVNPLKIISSSFLNPRATFSTPGGTNFNALFHGPKTGVFGGVTWDTPVDGLVLKAEYSSDAYELERITGNFRARSQFNVGASYEIIDNTVLSVDYLYGRALSGAVSFQMDPVSDVFAQRVGPQPPQPHVRSSEEQRAAINQLSGRQSPTPVSQFKSAALVDALWNRAIAAEDIAVNGRTLKIWVNDGNPNTTCRAAASVVAAGYFTLDYLVVQRGKAQTRCAVRQAPEPFDSSSSDGDTGAGPLHALLLASSRSSSGHVTDITALPAIRKDIEAQDIHVEAIGIKGADLVIYYSNFRYFHEADALDRMVRLLTNDAPPNVERFRLIATLGGVPQREFTVLRTPAERSYDQNGTYDIVSESESAGAPMRNPVLEAGGRSSYPRFSWTASPQFRQELFDPSNPFAVQLLGNVIATAELLPGLSIQGEGEVNFYDNFNVLRPPSSDLPHVRSDFLKYFSQGKNGIGDLEADYRFRLSPDVFAAVRVGYLESMYAGIGGEVLWRPEGQRWALGADLYQLRQRAYDRLFGLNPYETVTGHVSLYYASPWYGLNFAAHVGRYLAGDRGFTMEVTRRFDSGVEIGTFFTKTNVPAAVFGEGSFDKGIIIRIPLNWMVPINSQSQINMDLRPVQRDGGQRMQNDTFLFEETRRASEAEMKGISSPATRTAYGQ